MEDNTVTATVVICIAAVLAVVTISLTLAHIIEYNSAFEYGYQEAQRIGGNGVYWVKP